MAMGTSGVQTKSPNCLASCFGLDRARPAGDRPPPARSLSVFFSLKRLDQLAGDVAFLLPG